MAGFTSIHLENWKNFRLVDVPLQRRIFLVGANAVGKSNFLDAMRFLRDLAVVGGGFQEALRKRGGVSSVRSLAARGTPKVSLHVTMNIDDTEWIYRLGFTQDRQRRAIISKEFVSRAGKTLLERPDRHDNDDSERLTQTFLEQVQVNQEFRTVSEFFQSIKYLHIVPHLVRDPERSLGRSNDPFGGDFLEQIARTSERTRNARLKRIRDALRIAVPQLRELELFRDDRGTPHLRGKYEHWRPQGAWQTEDQFSDGTLRLLGLLWAVQDGLGPLLLEEPELSLHPQVVRFIPQMIHRIQRQSGRQIILSTHSSDLLNDRGIGLDEVLMLQGQRESTTIVIAKSLGGVNALLEGGVPLAEVITSRTSPQNPQQLALFGN